MMRTTNYFQQCLAILLFLPAVALTQSKNVSIRIQQDESILLDSFETQVVLQKKTFKIQVLLGNTAGIYCYAAFNDSIYRLTETEEIPGFSNLSLMAIAEEHFNKEKELTINPDGWAYWFYDPALNWHRFNKKMVFLDTNIVIGAKSIKQFYFTNNKKEVKTKDISQPLYLFFVAAAEVDADKRPLKELMRRKVKIEWVNEY
ncbi:MAG: hypothetical protein SGI83_15700 [Bacteroidota bacterium]|nr:hypothetical protein [Bacteroidota bacterium]